MSEAQHNVYFSFIVTQQTHVIAKTIGYPITCKFL